jgi:hypothetical protein
MSTLDPGVTGRRRSGAVRKANRRQKARAPSAEFPLTLTVPEAGRRYFNMSRNASYAAAERGEIPTVRIGKLLRVPVRAMEALLNDAGRGQSSEA